LPKASAALASPSPHRGVWSRLRLVVVHVDPGDGRPRGDSDRVPTAETPARPDLAGELLEPFGRHRRAAGQGPLGCQLQDRCDPLELARPIRLSGQPGEPLRSIRIAAANGQRGQNGPGEELDRVEPLDLAPDDAFALVPLAGPEGSQAVVVAAYDASVCTSCSRA